MTPVEQTDPAVSVPKANGRLIALAEFIAFLAFALVSKQVLDPYFWRYSGPVSLAITLLVLTAYMRVRGWSWSTMGLPALPDRRSKLMIMPKTLATFVAFAAVMAPILIGSEALNIEFMTEIPGGVEDRWGSVRGNLSEYLIWLGIVWTVAAFGEEMFFRGFLIVQLQKVFGETRWGAVLAVILAALVFGYGHTYYQGLRGFVTAGGVALAFGTCFLLFKRNLWPLIIVHGLIDTLSFTAMYLGWE